MLCALNLAGDRYDNITDWAVELILGADSRESLDGMNDNTYGGSRTVGE